MLLYKPFYRLHFKVKENGKDFGLLYTDLRSEVRFKLGTFRNIKFLLNIVL